MKLFLGRLQAPLPLNAQITIRLIPQYNMMRFLLSNPAWRCPQVECQKRIHQPISRYVPSISRSCCMSVNLPKRRSDPQFCFVAHLWIVAYRIADDVHHLAYMRMQFE